MLFFYLKNIRFPLLFTLLFGVGIVLKAGKGDPRVIEAAALAHEPHRVAFYLL